MTCACSRISSSGSMVSCMTPTRKGGAGVMRLLAGEGARELRPVLELAAERAVRALAADDDLHVVGDRRLRALLLARQQPETVRAVHRGRRNEDERVRESDRMKDGGVLAEPDGQVPGGLQAHPVVRSTPVV